MRVLLATDGSADSRRATRWLRDIALPSGTSVCVFTVAMLTDPPRQSQSMAELREKVRGQARRTAERAARMLRRRWPDIEVAVTNGDPRVEIVRLAEDTRMDMIVLGARGLGALKRLLIGSTSLAAARYAPCPVAIIRGRPTRPKRVLVAVDGSEASSGALRFLSISELVRDARVSLLHVLPKAVASRRRRSRRSVADAHYGDGHRQRHTEADDLLAKAEARLGDARYPVERLVGEGDPAAEIVRVAQGHDVDLVVLGARGLGTIGRILLGSVSETVLHHLGRPMVIVRER
jgi:nucleotide-binding universal stress UspA family protein